MQECTCTHSHILCECIVGNLPSGGYYITVPASLTAPRAKLSYCGYGSGKLKQPSQDFSVLWKFKSQVQVVNEL